MYTVDEVICLIQLYTSIYCAIMIIIVIHIFTFSFYIGKTNICALNKTFSQSKKMYERQSKYTIIITFLMK